MVTQNYRRFVLVCLFILTLVSGCAAFIMVKSAEGQSESCLVINEVAWAGTEASASDEWYEVANLCGEPLSTAGWYLETTQGDGDVVTATLPVTMVYADYGEIGFALFERTDDQAVSNITADGIHGSCAGCGGSLTGIFPNSDVVSFALYNADRTQYHIIWMIDGDWPAGSSSPRASMQANGIEWYTSNQSLGAQDAGGNPIFGTPGAENVPNTTNPNTCDTLPTSWDWDLDVVLFEDFSSRGEIYLEADLWGVAADGTLIQTIGQVTLAHFAQPNINGQTGWLVIETAWEEETSNACIDALEMLADGTENVLRGRPSGVADQSELWPVYADWLNAVLDFQKSGVFSSYLPVVSN